MNKAYLNCLTKKLTFSFEDMRFDIDLSEGGNVVKTKSGMFDLDFHWLEFNGDTTPQFKLYKLIKGTDVRTTFLTPDHDNPIKFEVIIEVGSKEDYLGKYYPRGYKSWAETLYLMSREAVFIENASHVESLKLMDFILKWVDEFEEAQKNADYSDGGKDEGMWEDYVFEFLDNKLSEF